MKYSDWPQRLAAYLTAHADKPFLWGTHDCALFIAGAVRAQTGRDIAADYRGYDDAEGALRSLCRVLRLKPSVGMAALLSAAMDRELAGRHDTPRLAQRGDVVLADVAAPEGGVGPALGLVGLDGQYACFCGPRGVVRLRVSECLTSWMVA